jgi:Na+-translocating ferredoxin:NAD+ oxidoreductase RnfD subunit
MVSLLRAWWADSRGKVVAVLLVLWIAALANQFRIDFVSLPFLAMLSSVSFDLFFGKLTRGRVRFSLSSLVTGLLIGLIFDPTSGALPIMVATLLASLSKHYVRSESGKHIFNPAAFGIVISSFLFQRPVAWWGASWELIPLFILSVGMVPALHQLRRLWMPITFLIIYFLTNSLSSSVESAFRLTLDGTVFLFAFVMLPEPITSVGRGAWRYTWGILVGGLVAGLSFIRFDAADPLLTALLAANVVGFVFVRNKSLTT